MSNEENVLRKNYGPNVENYIKIANQHNRHQSAGGLGGKTNKSQTALNVSREMNKMDQYNSNGRSGFFDMKSSPFSVAQKYQQNQAKWNEILKNKEMQV